MTTYQRIKSLPKAFAVLRYLSECREAASAQDVAKGVDLPVATVMCYLVTLEDERMVRCIGGGWELDMGLAIFWARRKAQLEGRIARDTNELNELEG